MEPNTHLLIIIIIIKNLFYVMQALMQLNDSLGCCFVELLQGLIDSGYVLIQL